MDEREALRRLGRAWGVQPEYTDVAGRRRRAPVASQIAVLRALGAPVERPADAARALREHELRTWQTGLEPFTAAWEGRPACVVLRLRSSEVSGRVDCCLDLEDGDVVQQRFSAEALTPVRSAEIDGQPCAELRVDLGSALPCGRHHLTVAVGRRELQGTLVVAPSRVFEPERRDRRWGTFLPLYALHGARSHGAGSYADLARLVEATADLGAGALATLPLCAGFLDDAPFDASPYRPASRLMWSDLHLALDESPEWERSAEARALVQSAPVRRLLSRLRRAPLVDHRAQQALQRRLLDLLVVAHQGGPAERQEDLFTFLRAHPHVTDYARFRATGERTGRPWPEWPEPAQSGRLGDGDFDPAVERRHALAQWFAAEQLGRVATTAARRDVRLILDLPLGVHPQGYDVWRRPELFAQEVSAGAPPDPFFAAGQTWCFPPLCPAASRAEAHRYVADCLVHPMRVAGMLRLDHVMSLNRLFWIPAGAEPADGVYVRYPADELYAVLCLESSRQRCAVVGEDLGTLPPEVRPAMRRHGLRRTFVLQHARGTDPRRPLRSLRIEGVAALHTHDMPPFAAFWRGLDVARRRRLGHLTADGARRERADRVRLCAAWERDLRRGGWLDAGGSGSTEVLRACLAFLADSAAGIVLVDLEDLWGETEPQNVPGTLREHPNWRRRARFSLERFMTLPRVRDALRQLAARRGPGEA